MVNRVSSYFPKGGHSATETELKNNLNTRKVKRHRFEVKEVFRIPVLLEKNWVRESLNYMGCVGMVLKEFDRSDEIYREAKLNMSENI